MGEGGGLPVAEDARRVGTSPIGDSSSLLLSFSEELELAAFSVVPSFLRLNSYINASGLLVTEIPESELKVSCRLHPISMLLLHLLWDDDDVEGRLLAGVGGDRIESFLDAWLADETGLEMFALTSLTLSRISPLGKPSMLSSISLVFVALVRILLGDSVVLWLGTRRFKERRRRRTASLSYDLCVAVELPLDPLEVVKVDSKD